MAVVGTTTECLMIKCPYCGKELDLQVLLTSPTPAGAGAKAKWYFSTYCFVIALMCVGPFALPLMWFNPRYKPITKILATVLILAVTVWLYYLIRPVYQSLKQQLDQVYRLTG